MAKYSANAAPVEGAMDPAFKLWLQITASRAKEEAFDEADSRHNDKLMQSICSKLYQHQYDRTLALKSLLSTVAATSIEGAAAQIAEAISRLDIIHDQYPEKAEDFDVKQDFQATERLLWSVLNLLVSKANDPVLVKPMREGLAHDPWEQDLEQIKAGIDARRNASGNGGAA